MFNGITDGESALPHFYKVSLMKLAYSNFTRLMTILLSIVVIALTPVMATTGHGTAVDHPVKCGLLAFRFAHLYDPAAVEGGSNNSAFSKSNARQTYHYAWKLVRDNYYDPRYNGQNWSNWEHRFDNEIYSPADAYYYIKLMLDSLGDSYTRVLNSQSFRDEQSSIDPNIGIVGLGVCLTQKDGKLIILNTIDKSPASNAAVQKGDEIVSINGTSCLGLTPDQAGDFLRGEAGTWVDFVVKRSPDNEIAFHLNRARFVIHSVTYKILDSNIGYIKLSTFMSCNSSEEFRDALEQLSATDGLIIDLRDNEGGFVSNSLEIADMLLERGIIVNIIGRQGKIVEVASGAPITHKPIVVLVNEESASASEILTGALKDNNRAVIIGTTTFGKGLVQEIYGLPDGRSAIHITVSRYQTPSGTDVNKVGVKPDVNVPDGEQQEESAEKYLRKLVVSLRATPAGP